MRVSRGSRAGSSAGRDSVLYAARHLDLVLVFSGAAPCLDSVLLLFASPELWSTFVNVCNLPLIGVVFCWDTRLGSGDMLLGRQSVWWTCSGSFARSVRCRPAETDRLQLVTQYLLLRAFHPGATLTWRVGVPIVVETISANPLDEALGKYSVATSRGSNTTAAERHTVGSTSTISGA